MNKSLLTNLIAIVFIIAGHFSPAYNDQILSIGYFALSGAITNWLAIYMLFEKVPGLYGSGVIPSRFEEFKTGIKALIMGQFFTAQNIKNFFENSNSSSGINLDGVVAAINYDKIFNDLLETVQQSSFGGMLAMFGGTDALVPLKEPFVEKVQHSIKEIANSDEIKNAIGAGDLSEGIVEKVESIVDQRLSELTPQMVKEIIQEMIKKHLGWLVVWGGIFGGLIGLVMSLVK